ncbi:MAG: saccharopine dehydrogenase NADP-binding domain-containing protein [Planctomycetes bacterium]|nr:saccharopine dehydrogenase NADP-binding domain-containing protein [Planctomycetota bacterium]
MKQRNVVVLGAGKVGRLVSRWLAESGDYFVTVVDRTQELAAFATKRQDGSPVPGIVAAAADLGDESVLAKLLAGKDYVVSCAPFHLTRGIARTALAQGVHYLDPTEDVATTKLVKDLSEGADRAFIPQCGLAPGFITIVANHVAAPFEKLDTVKMRVGALPVYPHNWLKYNLTWSTEGLINEYIQPCEAIVDGQLVTVPALQDSERLNVDGLEYEAFNTSGGLGTLADSWRGKVRNLNYKSIRYPGHRDLMELLLQDLKFRDEPNELKRVLERSLPHTYQDVVLLFVTVTGHIQGRYTQTSYVKKVYGDEESADKWGAIQLTTASGICGVLDLHAQGLIKQRGFVRQEEVPFEAFVKNRFGRTYA